MDLWGLWTILTIVNPVVKMVAPIQKTDGVLPEVIREGPLPATWEAKFHRCLVGGEVIYLEPHGKAWTAKAGCRLPQDVGKNSSTNVVYAFYFHAHECRDYKPWRLYFGDDTWRHDPAGAYRMSGKAEPNRPVLEEMPRQAEDFVMAEIQKILDGEKPPY